MKLNFLNLFLLSIIVFIFFPKAEGQMPLRELGIQTSDFESITAIYKKEKAPNVFMRYRFALVNFQYQVLKERDNVFNTSLGIAVGKERRRELTNKLDFFHGWEPSMVLNMSGVNNNFHLLAQPTLGYVLGFQYKIARHFLIAMETIPSLVGSISSTDSFRRATINARFNSNAISMSLAYQFEKKK